MAEETLTIYIPSSTINDTVSNCGQLKLYGYLSRICPNFQIIIIKKWALVASFTDDMKTACKGTKITDCLNFSNKYKVQPRTGHDVPEEGRRSALILFL
jgi:hypothetical protein